jgi:hypothetical protein
LNFIDAYYSRIASLDFFHFSHLLCIGVIRRANYFDIHAPQTASLELSYYDWSSILNLRKITKIGTFIKEAKHNSDIDNLMRVKVDEHSKYAIFERKQRDSFSIEFHWLREGKSCHAKVRIDMNPLFEPYGLKGMPATL